MTTDPGVFPGPAQTSRRVRRLLVLLRWGSLIAPILLLVVFAGSSRSRLERDAVSDATRGAELIGEYVLRTIEGQHLLLKAADQAQERLSFGADTEMRMHNFLGALTGAGGWDGVSLISPQGEYLISSERFPASGAFADPAYVARIPDSGLFVDRLWLEENQLLVVALRDGDSPDSNVWIAETDVEPIAEFLRKIVQRSNADAASVMRRDGRLLLRSVPMTAQITLPLDSPGMVAIAMADAAIYEAEATADGVHRLYATQRIGTLPLYANFGVGLNALRMAWFWQVLLASALLGSFGAIGYGIAWYAERALEAETARAAHDFDRKLLAEAQKTAATRETMLRELNHRINNNLQMIQSLIRLQKTREAGPDLDEISARILAIARIHDLLYQSGSSFHVDLAALLQSVASNSALVPPERGIVVDCDLEPVEADARVATPLALCVTELVTNAVKHAFGLEGGTIAIGLRAIDGGAAAEVTVSDDGLGLPETSGRNSGGRLIAALVVQIGGSLEMTPLREDAERPGARARIVFPLAVAEA
jgi:two-component sensor histidine kinase